MDLRAPTKTIPSALPTWSPQTDKQIAAGLSVPETPFVPKTTDPKDPKGPKGRNLYNPLIAGKGLQTLGQLAMLATGYDKVRPEYNPNEQRIEQLMANRNINTQALQNLALSQQNVALQNLSDVRSPGVRRALVNNVIQGTLKSMQQNRMQQDDMNNRYAAEYAQTLGSLGQQRVQANTYAEQANQQGKANFESGIQNMLATLGNTGQKLTDYKVNLAQQDLTASFLKTSDFAAALPSKLIGKLERGEDLDANEVIELRNVMKDKTPDEIDQFLEAHKKYRAGLNAIKRQ